MAVSQFPSIDPAEFAMTETVPSVITRSLSGRETRGVQSISYFTINAVYNTLEAANRKQIKGHFNLARGQLEEFPLALPVGYKDSTGDYSGTVTVSSNTSAGAVSIPYTITGTDATVFKSGDLFTISNSGKVYTVVADSTTSSLAGTVSFYPALTDAITTSDTLTHKNVKITVRYSNDMEQIVDNAGFTDMEIQFVEVV